MCHVHSRITSPCMSPRLADVHFCNPDVVGEPAQHLQSQLSPHQQAEPGLCGEPLQCDQVEGCTEGQPKRA